jgi:hypothetical protein
VSVESFIVRTAEWKHVPKEVQELAEHGPQRQNEQVVRDGGKGEAREEQASCRTQDRIRAIARPSVVRDHAMSAKHERRNVDGDAGSIQAVGQPGRIDGPPVLGDGGEFVDRVADRVDEEPDLDRRQARDGNVLVAAVTVDDDEDEGRKEDEKVAEFDHRAVLGCKDKSQGVNEL